MDKSYSSFLSAKLFIVGQVSARMQGIGTQERGVLKFHICVGRIFKGRGGSVHCLKYSLKFQGLNYLT